MIDSRAIIHESAQIANNVTVGPFSLIHENVVIEEGTVIDSHVVIDKNTHIGKHNRIYSHVALGGDPQHLTQKGENCRLVIGDHNVIREFITINRGTEEGTGITQIGSHNYLMAYCHVAHDCVIGNHVVFANIASIAGHVQIGDYAILGAFSGVHQFCRVGSYCFLGRAAKIYQDVLPYTLAVGNPAVLRGLNRVGLRRHGFDSSVMRDLKRAYHIIQKTDLNKDQICEELKALAQTTKEIEPLVNMIQTSHRGFIRNRVMEKHEDSIAA